MPKKGLLLLFFINFLFSQEIDENKYYAETKTVYLNSLVFNKSRELQIFLPDEYFKQPEKKFKTIYILKNKLHESYFFKKILHFLIYQAILKRHLHLYSFHLYQCLFQLSVLFYRYFR